MAHACFSQPHPLPRSAGRAPRMFPGRSCPPEKCRRHQRGWIHGIGCPRWLRCPYGAVLYGGASFWNDHAIDESFLVALKSDMRCSQTKARVLAVESEQAQRSVVRRLARMFPGQGFDCVMHLSGFRRATPSCNLMADALFPSAGRACETCGGTRHGTYVICRRAEMLGWYGE